MHDPYSDSDEISASINVTPFVDVVLVLLVIFMVTSDLIKPAAIDVDLPRAANGGDVVPHTLNLVLKQDGKLTIDGVATSEAALHERLKDASSHPDKPQVVIAADRAIDYGLVIHLIDLVKSHGIDNFALQIERG